MCVGGDDNCDKRFPGSMSCTNDLHGCTGMRSFASSFVQFKRCYIGDDSREKTGRCRDVNINTLRDGRPHSSRRWGGINGGLIRLEPSTPNCVHHTASCLAPIAILPFVGCKGGYPSVGLFSKFEVPKHEKKSQVCLSATRFVIPQTDR